MMFVTAEGERVDEGAHVPATMTKGDLGVTLCNQDKIWLSSPKGSSDRQRNSQICGSPNEIPWNIQEKKIRMSDTCVSCN
jgi:hypothetical protein